MEDKKRCGCRKTVRSEEEKKALITRLKKIEGQIRGMERMVEEDSYCPDILIQSSAAANAIKSFSKVLLGCHIRGCVYDDIRKGDEAAVDEFLQVLMKLMN